MPDGPCKAVGACQAGNSAARPRASECYPPDRVGRTSTCTCLARISHHLTPEARDRPAITSLRLLAVLDVQSSTPALVKRRAPRTDGPLAHFASRRGEKSGLAAALPPGAKNRTAGTGLSRTSRLGRHSTAWSMFVPERGGEGACPGDRCYACIGRGYHPIAESR